MQVVGIIPARYASTRFPGKPLADLGGKTIIQRVYEQANKAKLLSSVTVATDDQRIFDHVQSFGNAVMTSTSHTTGTERCYEAAKMMKLSGNDIIINIQGDEPLIHPQQIDLLARQFKQHAKIVTLIREISQHDLPNNNVVKVIFNSKKEAIYFSRLPIPARYRHIGMYGYRFCVLKKLVALPPSPLELAESLEQLRWLENGYTITIKETKYESIGIDTPDDLEKAIAAWKALRQV